MSKIFECLGDCADFDLVNGCVNDDQAEPRQADSGGLAAGGGGDYAASDGEDEGDEGSARSAYSSDVSLFYIPTRAGAPVCRWPDL